MEPADRPFFKIFKTDFTEQPEHDLDGDLEKLWVVCFNIKVDWENLYLLTVERADVWLRGRKPK